MDITDILISYTILVSYNITMDTEEALDMTEVAVEDIEADVELEFARQLMIPARTVSNEYDNIKSEHNYSAV